MRPKDIHELSATLKQAFPEWAFLVAERNHFSGKPVTREVMDDMQRVFGKFLSELGIDAEVSIATPLEKVAQWVGQKADTPVEVRS